MSHTCRDMCIQTNTSLYVNYHLLQWSGQLTILRVTPHSTNEWSTGSNSHSSWGLLAFLLHCSCLQVQHPPFKDQQEIELNRSWVYHLNRESTNVCALLYPCCCSLQLRAAPSAFLCHQDEVDHTARSRAIQTVTGWGRVSRSQKRKRCSQFHMTPQTGSRQLPLGWDASAPTADGIKVKPWKIQVDHGIIHTSSFLLFLLFSPFCPNWLGWLLENKYHFGKYRLFKICLTRVGVNSIQEFWLYKMYSSTSDPSLIYIYIHILLIPGRWERKVCKTHLRWCCHSPSETSCGTRPFVGWLICLVSVREHCMWAPYLTILWCRQSSCSASASQFHCGSPLGEKTREGGRGGEDRRDRDGGKRRTGGQCGVEFRVNVAMKACHLGRRGGNEIRWQKQYAHKRITHSQWFVKMIVKKQESGLSRPVGVTKERKCR